MKYALLLFLCAPFLLAACTDSAEQHSPSPADTTSSRSESVDTLQDTLTIGSQSESDTLRRYTAPPDFPLPFSTYVPMSLQTQTVSRGKGKTIRFLKRTDQKEPALIEFHLYQPSATAQGIRKRVRDKANAFGSARKQSSPYDWALAEYAFEGKHFNGTITLGRHDDLFFYLMVSYPPQADDAFKKRAQTVLEHWHWQEDGPSF